MASVERHNEFWSLLKERTLQGAVTWDRFPETTAAYLYQGRGGAVALTSRDDDGSFPLRAVIFDDQNNIRKEWSVGQELAWEDGAVEDAVRAIWDHITVDDDPVVALLNELRAIPPR